MRANGKTPIYKTNIFNLEVFLFLFLFLVLPFVQAGSDIEQAERLSIRVLPEFISSFSSYIRWSILVLISILYLFKSKQYNKNFTSFNFLITSFFIVLLLYSLVDQSDVIRYLGIVVLSIIVPLFTSFSFDKNGKSLLGYLKIILYLFIIGAVLFNGTMILSGLRFHGFSISSNSYGIGAIFWLSILLLPDENDKNKAYINSFFIGLLFLTIILSGSRNSLVGAIIVLLFHLRFQIKKIILPSLFILLVMITIVYYYDISFILDRLFNISHSISDSGRVDIWNQVLRYIHENLYWGNGMNAYKNLIDMGNVHNGYLRLLLSMGLVFTIFALIFYFAFLFKTVLTFRNKNIPPSLIGFFVAYTIANLGEDLFFGVGSTIVIYLFMALGLYTHYYKNTIKDEKSSYKKF